MPSCIRIALLGCGHHFHSALWADELSTNSQVDFAGVWDNDPGRASDLAGKHGVKCWTSRDELLESSALDAVAICSENIYHAESIIAAAGHGKHVYCEKPMAVTLGECDRVRAAIETAGVVYGQSFPKRFDPLHRQAVDMVRAGAIGRPVMVRLRHGHNGAFGKLPGYQGSWFCDPETNGAGSFMDEGIHIADFLNWLCGKPKSVAARVTVSDVNAAADQGGIALYEMPEDVIAELCTGSIFYAANNTTEIYGDEGCLIVQGTDLASRRAERPPTLYLASEEGGELSPVKDAAASAFGTPDYHKNGLRAFVGSLIRKEQCDVGIDAGRDALETVLAAYASARSKTTVAFPFNEDHPYRLKELLS